MYMISSVLLLFFIHFDAGKRSNREGDFSLVVSNLQVSISWS